MLTKSQIKSGNRVRLLDSDATANMISYATLADIGLHDGSLGTIVRCGADKDGDVLVRWDNFQNPVKHPSGDSTVLWVNKDVLEIN